MERERDEHFTSRNMRIISARYECCWRNLRCRWFTSFTASLIICRCLHIFHAIIYISFYSGFRENFVLINYIEIGNKIQCKCRKQSHLDVAEHLDEIVGLGTQCQMIEDVMVQLLDIWIPQVHCSFVVTVKKFRCMYMSIVFRLDCT